ncbi:MAG: lpxK, partial [Candidatus Binatus sp.]|nr:lpxK [Candidatus Binatus sp.]
MKSRAPKPERLRIERLWERDLPTRDLPLWLPLAAASGFYRVGSRAREIFWRVIRQTSRQRSQPAILSVGNLTVGGNGKTPFTLYLANRLRARGLRVGIVSRGYNRNRATGRAELIANDGILKVSQDDAGDEPAMMAKAFNGPIAVARRRIHAVELLRSLGPLDVVLLDDAFQHLRLERDLDLVLVNDDRGFGNGWLLPAGPMREPISAVRRADAIILISSGGRGSALLPLEVKILESRPLLRASLRPRALIASENGSWREL